MLKTATILIKKNNENYRQIDNLCFKAKNLYNRSLFLIKKHFEAFNSYLNFYELDKYYKHYEEHEYYIDCSHLLDIELYKVLPNATSQQVLKSLDSNFNSYFKVLKEYRKNKIKFKSIPKSPKFLNKKEGKYFLIFSPNQFSIKKNYLYFPKKSNLKPIRIDKKIINNKIQQVRIIPKLNSYNIEIVYKYEVENKSIESNKYIAAIDLGLNNLCTFISDNDKFKPLIFNGKKLKTINNFFNKKKAKIQSELNKDLKSSNKIKNLCSKRERKIKNELHLISKRIIEICELHNISKLIIGYNKNWKQNVDLGNKVNQRFVQIPYYKLIQMLKYKAEEKNIELILQEESYTSKLSSIDLEDLNKKENFLGKRIKRGLFESENKKLFNADVNGAYNILRKYLKQKVSNIVLKNLISKGCMVHPIKINELERFIEDNKNIKDILCF